MAYNNTMLSMELKWLKKRITVLIIAINYDNENDRNNKRSDSHDEDNNIKDDWTQNGQQFLLSNLRNPVIDIYNFDYF